MDKDFDFCTKFSKLRYIFVMIVACFNNCSNYSLAFKTAYFNDNCTALFFFVLIRFWMEIEESILIIIYDDTNSL